MIFIQLFLELFIDHCSKKEKCSDILQICRIDTSVVLWVYLFISIYIVRILNINFLAFLAL